MGTEQVRSHYADLARAADRGTSCCDVSGRDAFGAGLYEDGQIHGLPTGAARASLGCGNPPAVADLAAGESVLDLGSGGGIDVLLSARRVGPGGHVYGLDMTDEMLELAGRHAAEAGATNVTLLKGHIEAVPLPAASVDVVISNCVLNLSPDKAAVLAEIARVLRPGGRVGLSDVVAEDRLSPAQRADRGNRLGCVAGALSVREYVDGLRTAGLANAGVTFTHEIADGIHGATVRAVKPPAGRR